MDWSFLGMRYYLIALLIFSHLWADQFAIVVDNSGSMRKTDPSQYTKKGIEIISLLVDSKNDLSLSYFDQNFRNVLPLNKFNDEAKAQLIQKLSELSFDGQRTNIPLALEKINQLWRPEGHRHLILLTDGMTDISKNSDKNTLARNMIINQILPQLQSNKVTVHTLSLGQKSDEELLKVLSHATGGLWRKITKEQELYDFMIKIFSEKSAYQGIPYSAEHEFLVDPSIEDLIIVINSTSMPAIITPDSKLKTDVKELSLIHKSPYWIAKIAKPNQGIWKLLYEEPASFNIFASSQIILDVNVDKTHLLPYESIYLNALVHLPSDMDSLSVLSDIKWTIQNTEFKNNQIIQDVNQPNKFFAIINQLQPNQNEIIIKAEHQFFSRQKTIDFIVHEQPLTIQEVIDDHSLTLKIELDHTFWKNANSSVKVVFMPSSIPFIDCSGTQYVYSCILPLPQPEGTQFAVNVTGYDLTGKERTFNTSYEKTPILSPLSSSKEKQENKQINQIGESAKNQDFLEKLPANNAEIEKKLPQSFLFNPANPIELKKEPSEVIQNDNLKRPLNNINSADIKNSKVPDNQIRQLTENQLPVKSSIDTNKITNSDKKQEEPAHKYNTFVLMSFFIIQSLILSCLWIYRKLFFMK